jgi:hypothetical protein
VDEVTSAAQLAQIVIRRLARGKAVEVDGLGVFYPDAELGVRFEPRSNCSPDKTGRAPSKAPSRPPTSL